LYLPERRVKVPKGESWYADAPLGCAAGVPVKLWGIHKNGRARLRIASTCEKEAVQFKLNPPMREDDGGSKVPFDTMFSDDPQPPAKYPSTADLEDFLGHGLDDFQTRCLAALTQGSDVLGMAPTGSGKTAVAMMGILAAFQRDKRVIYTSPIKALSNEKYKSLSEKLHGRVTLLTGDIKDRAVVSGGDGAGELLIMTAEILRNKLTSSKATGVLDPDLVGVEIVFQDEVHYINDPERGPVWEETVMMLSKDIQVISLSATLSEPENFREWLSQRRHTQIVQRHDRHVPLHIGGLSGGNSFEELMCTHGSTGINSSVYKGIAHQRSSSNYSPIVQALIKDDKCPAIIFCMSRKGCVHAAGTVTKNLMLSPAPNRKANPDITDEEFEELLTEHSVEVRTYEERWRTLYNRNLQKHHDAISTLPHWEIWISALKRGIAYHHAGMVPILREFVEMLFQAKMIKCVFATETLGVGINMPARTVVFTQMNKPTGGDGASRWLRPDEFWQMAGRAGRRGMDTHGYVMYVPTRKPAPFSVFQSILKSSPPPTKSQLQIDHVFVLKNLDAGKEVLAKSLFERELRQERSVIAAELGALDVASDLGSSEGVKRMIYLEHRLNDPWVKLPNKQIKKARADLYALKKEHGVEDLSKFKRSAELADKLKQNEGHIDRVWRVATDWLCQSGFLTTDLELTVPGRAAQLLCDGQPLARANAICDGHLAELEFAEIMAWLALFVPLGTVDHQDDLPALSGGLKAAIAQSGFGEEVSQTSARLVYLWCTEKHVGKICHFLPMTQLGTFVKMILRVSSFVEEMLPVLLGMEKFELYNLLLNHQEKLFYGIVTNRSLYVIRS